MLSLMNEMNGVSMCMCNLMYSAHFAVGFLFQLHFCLECKSKFAFYFIHMKENKKKIIHRRRTNKENPSQVDVIKNSMSVCFSCEYEKLLLTKFDA